jgi:hypothetical protein
MGSLAPFWHHLERHPHASETRAEWQRILGQAFPAVVPHLTSTGRFASFVSSPRLNAPDLRVVQYRDGTVAAVCDAGETPTLPLTPDDLGLMTVSMKSLRSAVSGSLGLRTSTVTVEPLPGVLRIGAWEPQPDTAFPVILVAHPDDRQVGVLLRKSVLETDKPTLVLTPTDEAWTDEMLAWCEARRVMPGSLAELIEHAEDHAWGATDAWDELLDGFARRAGFTRQAGTQNKRRRRKRGDFLVKIESIGRELVLEAESRVNIVKFAIESKQEPALPPITKAEICKRAGAKPHDFSRAAAAPSGESFDRIFNLMQDPDGLLRWWANHRRATPACS